MKLVTKEDQEPTKAFFQALAYGLLFDKFSSRGPVREHQKPGRVIMGMPAASREALKRLTSDDVANIRPDIALLWV